MKQNRQNVLHVARLGATGRLTIPAEHRRALALSEESPVLLVRVGDALVLAPCDDAFSAGATRLEARMHEAGSHVEDLLAAAAAARSEIAREEFGAGEDE